MIGSRDRFGGGGRNLPPLSTAREQDSDVFLLSWKHRTNDLSNLRPLYGSQIIGQICSEPQDRDPGNVSHVTFIESRKPDPRKGHTLQFA